MVKKDQIVSAYALPGLKVKYRFPMSIHTSDSVNYIRCLLEDYFKIDRTTLESPLRERYTVMCRAITFYLLRRYTTLSFKDIGRLFGGRDHTTVMHSIEKLYQLIETEQETREIVRILELKVQEKQLI